MFSSNTSQASSDANYIEDVFSTYLYTGNGSTQTINNGIDLAGKGGLVWRKQRTANSWTAYTAHSLSDTARGINAALMSNRTDEQATGGDSFVTAFNANGFSMGADSSGYGTNKSTENYVSWTFRKQPKFFDVVTYTGNGTTNNITHALGSTPGCIIIKRTSGSGNWATFARDGTTSSKFTYTYFNSASGLNLTAAAGATGVPAENLGFITSTVFKANDLNGSGTVGGVDNINDTGATYVAYLFAHNAGGFGLTGTDNVISCGSGSWSGGSDNVVNLGYEAQWVLYKSSDIAGSNWMVFDTMRGMSYTASEYLRANLSAAAGAYNSPYAIYPTATGFTVPAGSVSTGTYIYIAIRRGPMKTPTSGTSVFSPSIRTGTGTTTTVSSTSFPPDLYINGDRTYGGSNGVFDRLRGRGILQSLNTAAENATSPPTYDFVSWGMNGEVLGEPYNINMTGSGRDFVDWNFGRAPSFMDVVCYTGTGGTQTLTHNLGVAPELSIFKSRSGTSDWTVYYGGSLFLRLNLTSAGINDPSISPTATTVNASSSLGSGFNTAGVNYVAYLFASCPGVSKVGSVTHVEPTTVVCGFTPRFVMLKSTATTGTDDWFVFDSARGITSGNDPYLRLNSTGAENTPFGAADLIDPTADGFIMNGFGGGNYIYLAIA